MTFLLIPTLLPLDKMRTAQGLIHNRCLNVFKVDTVEEYNHEYTKLYM